MNSYTDYPLLITRGVHIFPKCHALLDVGRPFSLLAISNSLSSFDGNIIVVSQKNLDDETNLLEAIYQEGTLCSIDAPKDEKGILKVRLTGIKHVRLTNTSIAGSLDSTFYYLASAKEIKNIPLSDSNEEKELVSTLANALLESTYEQSLPRTLIYKLQKGISAEEFVDQLSHNLPLGIETKQLLLEERSIKNRISKLIEILKAKKNTEIFEKEINQKVRERAEDSQKEYFLREKLKAIQSELDEMNGEENDEEKILKKLDEGLYPDHVKAKVISEVKKQRQMPPGSLEASMAKSYIDWLIDLPWLNKTEDNNSLDNARKVLDEDHYGLEKVKERILEYLAVKSMTNSLKAPILCLYGPPGVGKTSLAKSVARALGRKFVKASLGGISDETEIRGHRRTYVASMPGKIIKGIKNAGVCNPVFLLDEIDKLTSNIHGDPASALLEVLDPEQNALFQDNYIEETYDLSNVLFICTANYLENIPYALKDRLELIELNSYTELEKIQIAKNHLIQKECLINGLKTNQIRFEDEAIKYIINYYTREAGVRELQRKIATCCRKAIVELLSNKNKRRVVVDKKKVKAFLGTEIFDYSTKSKKSSVGVVTGLAYTQYGGDILPIEVTYFDGKGNLILTGNLGNVMKESASIAFDYVKANAKRYDIKPEFFLEHDVHIHVPEGAVPKDGPSAGVALTCAVVSAVKNIPCKATVAMTGEVNLRGQATAIGGLKEKSLAALRSGIKLILIPQENERNLSDLPSEVKEGLQIKPITCVDDALKEILENYDFLKQ